MAYTTDPIADLLTRIRNANRANHDSLELSHSKIKAEVCRILAAEGFIKSFEVVKQTPQDKIKISLKYGTKREKSHHKSEAHQQTGPARLLQSR